MILTLLDLRSRLCFPELGVTTTARFLSPRAGHDRRSPYPRHSRFDLMQFEQQGKPRSQRILRSRHGKQPGNWLQNQPLTFACPTAIGQHVLFPAQLRTCYVHHCAAGWMSRRGQPIAMLSRQQGARESGSGWVPMKDRAGSYIVRVERVESRK